MTHEHISQRESRRFLAMLGGNVALLLGAIAAFNLAVDPFRAYRLGLVEGLDRHKVEVGRVMKAEMLRSNGAATVVLGSSRIVRSIDTEHPAWTERPVVNAGNGGANASEIVQGVRLALAQPETKRLVVFVDFHMCGSRQGPEHDFKQSAFDPDLSWPARHAILLTSRYAIERSLETLDNREKGRGLPTWPITGYRDMGEPLPRHDHRALFDLLIRDSLRMRMMYGRFEYLPASVDALQTALRRAIDRGADVTLAIPPIHAEQLATIDAARLWDDFERFKRDLTRAADALGAELHDFAVYDDVTTEPVPEAPGSPMTYWWESSHSTAATGSLVIEQLTGRDTFGVRLTPGVIEAHLDEQRAARKVWLETHPSEVANIERLLRSVPRAHRPYGRRDG